MIHDVALQATHVLAQVDTITPDAPPGSKGVVKILQYALWGVLLAGILAIIIAGGVLGWEKFNGGVNTAPKMVVGALIGGIVAVSASGLINGVLAAL
ncbi:hypothetical protein [Nocardia veterana]|uniref:Uncharacterized protein n=1 Tax=Nocardia veterana TaxID=132249 RepID=A0A7X6M468_9NOCA|nr:hypothetical protein [Nocardia veterana]NKY88887.1 hypothetical protein [Nocardia veterana]